MVERALLDYLFEFHATRDYFECHEILEERWKLDPRTKRKIYWVALIQIAVGFYHWRRGNLVGANVLLQKGLIKTGHTSHELEQMGINVDELLRILTICLDQVESGQPYESRDIPLNTALAKTYETYCQQAGLPPYQKSDIADNYLINKHILRPR